jgi:hypothetical protein
MEMIARAKARMLKTMLMTMARLKNSCAAHNIFKLEGMQQEKNVTSTIHEVI